MATLEEVHIEDEIDQEILNSSTDDIVNRTRLLENDIKVTASPAQFLMEGHEIRDTTVNA
jgi:26S proteasome regulatory subunit T5